MAGGGSHNKRDGNRYEDCGTEVDELLVLGKHFEALVENRNKLKSEKSLYPEASCVLPGWPRGQSYPPARPVSQADGAKIDCPCFCLSGSSVQ
jgi:hypothetical protein